MARNERSSVEFWREAVNLHRHIPTFRDTSQDECADFFAWFNDEELARYREVDGRDLICILVRDKRHRVIPGGSQGEGYDISGRVLYVRQKDVRKVNVGQSIRVDGKLYVIEDVYDMQGLVWRLELSGNDV